MNEIKLSLIFECEDVGEFGMDDLTLIKYLEAYLINKESLEAAKLRILAGDKLPSVGFNIKSVKRSDVSFLALRC